MNDARFSLLLNLLSDHVLLRLVAIIFQNLKALDFTPSYHLLDQLLDKFNFHIRERNVFRNNSDKFLIRNTKIYLFKLSAFDFSEIKTHF